MSIDNPSAEPTETNLDDFAAELFGRSKPAPEPTSSEELEVVEEGIDAPEEDTHVDVADTDAPDNEDNASEDEPANTQAEPKPKKNSVQERINEAVGKQRRAERLAEELSQKLEEAIKRLETKDTPTPTPEVKVSADGPKPTDKNEDGTEKYPLGEFDPDYVNDVVEYKLDKKLADREQKVAKSREQEAREAAQAELQSSWNDKLAASKERYPDFEEKGEKLVDVFEGVNEAYGEYLTDTLMGMEYGPDVLYYLANNVDEARKIVDSGAKKATIAFGRLEAKFAFADEEKQKARPKVSAAPEPPAHVNRGAAVTPPSIRGDEKDLSLDDFSRALFAKKK